MKVLPLWCGIPFSNKENNKEKQTLMLRNVKILKKVISGRNRKQKKTV